MPTAPGRCPPARPSAPTPTRQRGLIKPLGGFPSGTLGLPLKLLEEAARRPAALDAPRPAVPRPAGASAALRWKAWRAGNGRFLVAEPW
ncbi:hypothetical protein NDU88_000704 [Pleurodeles waltl]|uniref:Uncharacterized protein n=1 Tax=Pleurodeles waltl TaxID=8319 RepID=A0AAV7L7P8_PLEWA|nr:hypothetical protein NDU88_000704 [Pleurodeles waltl]